MLSHELVQAWRDSVADTVEPYLWSDREAYRFLNDAYFMFVRLTGGVPDFGSAECEVQVRAGEAFGDLHPSVLRIMSATLRSKQRPIKIVNSTDLPSLTTDDYGGRAKITDFNSPGDVSHMVIGMVPDRVRFVMVPMEDDVVDLQIYRLPLSQITRDNQKLCDVSVIHHEHLMHWMSFRAYGKQDADAFDPRRAEYHKAEFERYCAQALRERERYKHKNRVVVYGGL